MIKEFTFTIPELTGNMLRKAYIYLPDNYDADTSKHYPVLYVFDGQNAFFDEYSFSGLSWKLDKYFSQNNIELIIIALESNPDMNVRLSEYSPFDFKLNATTNIKGTGKIFMEWLVNVFKPFIDNNYRTLTSRNHTILYGASMGGLIAMYGVIAYNNVFSKAGCLSPSLWTDIFSLSNLISLSHIDKDTKIYISFGSKEFNFIKKRLQIDKKSNEFKDYFVPLLLEKTPNIYYKVIPGGKHNDETFAAQTGICMPYLLL